MRAGVPIRAWVKSRRAPDGAIPVNEELDQEDHVEGGGHVDPELRVLLELWRRGVESGAGWVDSADGRVLRGRHFGRFGESGAGSQSRRLAQRWARGVRIGASKRGGCTRAWTAGGRQIGAEASEIDGAAHCQDMDRTPSPRC